MLILVCVYYTPVHSMMGEDTPDLTFIVLICLSDLVIKMPFFQNQRQLHMQKKKNM